MPASFALALTLLALLIVLRFVQRGTVSDRMRRLMTDTKDPDGAKAELRELFEAEKGKEQDHRAVLWHQARTDRGAAKHLRRLLMDDLEGQELTRQTLANSPDAAEALRVIEEERAETSRQLARLDALVRQVGP